MLSSQKISEDDVSTFWKEKDKIERSRLIYINKEKERKRRRMKKGRKNGRQNDRKKNC